MFSLQFEITDNTKRITKATDDAAFRNFTHGVARISKDAKASIITSDEPSPEGTPPHTRAQRGHNLRSAIRFDANKVDGISGPIFSQVGLAGEAHEKGGMFRGEVFEPRPFMVPALMKSKDRWASEWQGSIGG